MLPKSKRLNLKKDFKRVASGKKTETAHFKIFITSSLKTLLSVSGDESGERLKLSRQMERSGLSLKYRKPRTLSPRKLIKTTSHDFCLVGISLAKKTFKLATQRNKARRIASKAVEEIYERLPKGMNLIIMPKAQILSAKSEDLSLELKNVLLNNSTH